MTTKAATAFQPDWVSPPGDTISDLLEERGWTQAELANRTGFTTKHINLLITGKAAITEETALKLERVLGSTAQFWLRREAQYREALARNEENEEFRIALFVIGAFCFVDAAISGRWIIFAIGALCWLAAREIVAAYGAQSE